MNYTIFFPQVAGDSYERSVFNIDEDESSGIKDYVLSFFYEEIDDIIEDDLHYFVAEGLKNAIIAEEISGFGTFTKVTSIDAVSERPFRKEFYKSTLTKDSENFDCYVDDKKELWISDRFLEVLARFETANASIGKSPLEHDIYKKIKDLKS